MNARVHHTMAPARTRRRAARAMPAVLAVLLGFGNPQPQAAPGTGTLDSRLRSVEYSPDQVVRLRGRVGFQIDVQFELGEAFLGMGSGDASGLAYFAQDNHLFLKPKATHVTTNITVLTSRRVYQFDYGTDGDAEVMFAVRFRYPVSPNAAASASGLGSMGGAGAAPVRNTDYWYCGAPTLMPAAAWDDGVHTHIRFGSRAEQPAVFVHNEDGSESLLNYNMDGEDVVIQRLARQFILRRGSLYGCVVNRGYQGSGERLATGTVVPEVRRALSGVGP